MSEIVKCVNKFFKYATKPQVDYILNNTLLSERQTDIFYRFFIKKQDLNFIADTLGICPRIVTKELSIIRHKIIIFLM